MDEIESVAGSLKIPDSAIPPEQLNRRSSLKQPSPSICVSASRNFEQHAPHTAKVSRRIRYQPETRWRERCLSPLICDERKICIVWLEKQEMEQPTITSPANWAHQGKCCLNQAWVWPAALKKDARPYAKQLSLSDSLEKQASVPLRNTLRLKSQRLRQWELDIHHSSKEDLVGHPSLYPSA